LTEPREHTYRFCGRPFAKSYGGHSKARRGAKLMLGGGGFHPVRGVVSSPKSKVFRLLRLLRAGDVRIPVRCGLTSVTVFTVALLQFSRVGKVFFASGGAFVLEQFGVPDEVDADPVYEDRLAIAITLGKIHAADLVQNSVIV